MLVLCQNVNAVTNYLPLSWSWESDYLQGPVYSQGAAGYVVNDLCHAVVDIDFTNMGGVCAYGAPGTQYGFSGTLVTECLYGTNILNYTKAGQAYPFIMNDITNRQNESFVLRTDFAVGATTYGASTTTTCDPTDDYRTCTMTFSSTFDGNANYVCYNDSITTAILKANDYQLGLYVDSLDGFAVSSGHDHHNLFYDVYDVNDSFIVLLGTDSVGRTWYIENGTNFDLGFYDAKYDEVSDIDKTLIVNISNYPSDINLSLGETGLWDCDSVGKSAYYPFESIPMNMDLYEALKKNCCNLLVSMNPSSNCGEVPVIEDDGVDQYGDISIDVDMSLNSLALKPVFVYYINDEDYPNHFVSQRIDLTTNNNPQIVSLLFGGGLTQVYKACFNFYDGVNGSSNPSPITVTDSWWAYSQFGDYFKNEYGKLDVDSTSLTVETSNNYFYKTYFEASGYDNSEAVIGQFNLNPTCTPVFFNRNISASDKKYNATVYGKIKNRDGVKEGIDLVVTCERQNNRWNGRTISSGFFIEDILDLSWCKVYYELEGCDGGSEDRYVNGANRDFNFSIKCPDDYGDGDGDYETNTTSPTKDLKFFVHEEGYGVGKPSIRIDVTGSQTRWCITNSMGFCTITRVPKTGFYSVQVNDNNYAAFANDYDGSNPFDISLIPFAKFNKIDIKTLNNGSVQGNVTLTVTSGGKTIVTGMSSSYAASYGMYAFDCEVGSLYTVEASYLGKTATLKDVECPEGEGSPYNIDITGGAQGALGETGDSIVDFAAWMWYIVEILILMFALLVFKRLGDEILH